MIAGHPATDVYPDWSPDGELVFVSDRDGASKIHVADPEQPDRARLLLDVPVNPGDAGAGQGAMAARWSPDGELIGFIRSSEDRTSLWCVRRDGSGARELVPDARGFDWFRDNDHVIFTRSEQGRDRLWIRNVQTGTEVLLWTGPHIELDAAPDGHAILMSHGPSHLGMGLWRLALRAPVEAGGLPTVLGDAQCLVAPDGNWHVHHGSFDFTSKRMVYVHDQDYSNVYERVPRD